MNGTSLPRSVAVAEHAIMLMLATARSLVWQHTSVASGIWRGNDWQNHHVFELSEKTLGIVGFGRIGRAVAEMAFGLGMRVTAYDPYATDSAVPVVFADGQTLTFHAHLAPFAELLATSDFVTLHVGGKDQVLGAAELAQMKPGSILINAARGGVVDEVALLHALDHGPLAAAGLDVFVDEPTPAVQVLMHPKVSLTPHIGAATLEAQDRIGVELADQLIALANA
jgi:D-3-phosphoglycerate dehydrogenase